MPSDTERLDWLANNMEDVRSTGGYFCYRRDGARWVDVAWYGSLRECIDAAMQSTSPNEPKQESEPHDA